MSATFDRRAFLKAVGGGIVVLVRLRSERALAQGRGYPSDLNAYLRIGEDGRVTVFSGKIEMGQGVLTSLAQMAAEDLGVGLDAIEMVMGDTDRCPWDMGTFGSLTTRMFGPALRTAAAEARQVLMRLASERLGVPQGRLVVENGVVSVTGEPSRKVTYGSLAKGQALVRTVDEKAVLRTVGAFTVMGRSPLRLDAVDKVTGAGRYAGDVRLPGLLHARILRPPAHGATLVRVDTSEAAKRDGVTVVNQEGLVAVLHADPEVAEAALGSLKPEWNPAPPGADTEGIFADLLGRAPQPEVKGVKGDVETARGAADAGAREHVREGLCRPRADGTPHLDGRVRERKADGLGLDPDALPDPGRARAGPGARPEERPGRHPLRRRRVRREELRPPVRGGGPPREDHRAAGAGGLHPRRGVLLRHVRPGLRREDRLRPRRRGKITLWDYDVYFAGDRAAELFYDVPNVRMRVFGGWRGPGADAHRFGVGPWRAPGANMNVFARESHVDVMAAAAKIDPLDFRLRNTSDPRARSVLQAAAKAFGWTPVPGPSGRGQGIACGLDSGSYAALAVSVTVDRASGAVKVERVVCAQDMGVVVNPDGATMQVEGCITMGLGYVLSEEVQFRGGQILDDNFDTYTVPRFSWLPRIETVLVKNDALTPQGGGEPAIVPMGAAIANAVFDATGTRLFRLPMTPARVKAALEQGKGK